MVGSSSDGDGIDFSQAAKVLQEQIRGGGEYTWYFVRDLSDRRPAVESVPGYVVESQIKPYLFRYSGRTICFGALGYVSATMVWMAILLVRNEQNISLLVFCSCLDLINYIVVEH